MSIAHVQYHGGSSQLWVDRALGPLPGARMDLTGGEKAAPLPFLGIGPALISTTPNLELPPPELTVSEQPLANGKYLDYNLLSYASTPAEGVQVILRFKKNSNLDLEIFDIIYELPEATAALLQDTRGPATTPAQNSDLSIVLCLVDLGI